jgi:multisubunit Na+/H+ antiporter MnhG subunit
MAILDIFRPFVVKEKQLSFGSYQPYGVSPTTIFAASVQQLKGIYLLLLLPLLLLLIFLSFLAPSSSDAIPQAYYTSTRPNTHHTTGSTPSAAR